MKPSFFTLLQLYCVVLLPLNAQVLRDDTGIDARNRDIKPYTAQFPCRLSAPVSINTEGFALVADSGSLKHDITISLSIIAHNDGAIMPSNMENVGWLSDGVRLLPNGEHFSEESPALISLAYDPARIPQGYSSTDIYTYYCEGNDANREGGLWHQLERVSIDTIQHMITSYTTHFTDFANAVIKVPDMPESKAYVPTAMTDLPDANPMKGIPMVEVPTANNRGTAELTYPIELPKGRHGMQPNVDLHYSSVGGNGILGVGWSINMPAITIDTRWGVPRYDEGKETEAYLVNGEQVLMYDKYGQPIELANRSNKFEARRRGDVRFYARDRRNQDYIIRSGKHTREYYWIVTERSGATYYYGFDPFIQRIDTSSILTDGRGNIAEWSLTAIVDVYGNYVRFYYDKDRCPQTGKEIEKYLYKIEYTGNTNTNIAPIYTINFRYTNHRNDVIIDGRLGFLRTTNKVLCTIQVVCKDTAIASYVMEYDSCSEETLNKMRLRAITKYDAYDIQCRYSEIMSPIWEEFYQANQKQNEYVHMAETKLFNKETIESLEDISGSRTTFEYQNAHPIKSLFTGTAEPYHQKNLGANSNHSFGGGSSFTVGIGPDIMQTSNSIGGNFTINYGYGTTDAMMMDMNGDGLPDYVYKKGDSVRYKKQLPNGSFATDTIITNLTHLVSEHNLSYGLGFQASIPALQVNASPLSFANSFTDKYFADINNDHLPDLVTSDGVLVNRLDYNGNPTFELQNGDNISTNSKYCERTIVRNGEVDPRLECELFYEREGFFSWRDLYDEDMSNPNTKPVFESKDEMTVEELINQYKQQGNDKYTINSKNDLSLYNQTHFEIPLLSDKLNPYSEIKAERLTSYPKLDELLSKYTAPDYKLEPTPDGIIIYRLIENCSYKDSLPHVDVVRVWVADTMTTIHLNSKIRLSNDNIAERLQSRKADGVIYTIQWCQNIEYSSKLSTNNYKIIKSAHLNENTLPDWHSYDTTFVVSQGDILMFRLSAHDNHLFDDTEWLHEIADVQNNKIYKSEEDFYCWQEGNFKAIYDGTAAISVGIKNDISQAFTVSLYNKTELLKSLFVGNKLECTIDTTVTVNAGDSIYVTINYTTEPQWSKIVITPIVNYEYSHEGSTYTTEYKLGSTINGGVSHLKFTENSCDSCYEKYKELFGVLHKNWGQFAYKNQSDYDEYIQVQDLSNYTSEMYSKMLDSQSSNQRDTKLENYKDAITAAKTSAEVGLTNLSTLEISLPDDLLNEYDPYSKNRHWISMLADAATQRWLALGNIGAIGASLQSCSLQPIAGTDTTSVEIVNFDSSIPLPANGNKVTTVRKHSYSYQPNASVGTGIAILSANAHLSGGFNEVTCDFMDMNGDGYPDFIGKNSVQYTTPWGGIGELVADTWQSFRTSTVSVGAGCSGSKSFVREQTINSKTANRTYNIGITTGTDYSYSKVNVAYVDINGDGLPDMVRQGAGSGGNTVRYNIGYSFTDEYPLPDGMEINTHHNISTPINTPPGVSVGFSIEQHSLSAGISYNTSCNSPAYRMIDIDGDGYLDIVHASQNAFVGKWSLEVLRNQNNQSWNTPTYLKSDVSPYSRTHNLGTTASFSAGITFLGIAKVVINPQFSPYSYSNTQSHMEWLDMNGDGYVDLVDDDIIYYNANGLQPTNLLIKATNPTGQTISLNYTQSVPTIEHAGRSWLLESVVDELPKGYEVDERSVMTKRYEYNDAHYDTYEKSDYGFKTVRSIDDSIKHVYRVLEQTYANEHFLNHGDLLQDSLSDGEKPYIVNTHSVKYGYPDDPNKENLCQDLSMIRYKEEHRTYYYEGHKTPEIVTACSLTYDSLYNIILREDRGDLNDNADDIEQRITYEPNKSRRNNQISLPIEENILHGSKVLRNSRMKYNQFGSPIHIDLNNTSMSSVTELKYDIYGNIIETLSPENDNHERVNMHYIYDAETQTYPVFICNQFGETQITTYDVRFGAPTLVVDPAGNAIHYRYDPMGRLIDVVAPQEDNLNMTTVHYDYHLPFHNVQQYISPKGTIDSRFPYVSKMMFAERNLCGAEVTLYDARGTALQKKIWQNVYGADMWAVQGANYIDMFGRVIGLTTPYIAQLPVCEYDTLWRATSATMTKLTYDILDRKCMLTHPDGNTQTYTYDFGADDNGIIRLSQKITNENSVPSVLLQSPQGWTIQQNNPMKQNTKFTYNALGELITATDADGYTTQYEYDMLGRMVRRIHPDAGETQWEYDAMGNLTHQRTATLRQMGLDIKYLYNYNRLVEVEYPLHDDLNVLYKYYTDGRLAERYDACGLETFRYDEMGNVSQSDRWIYVPSEDYAFLFVHQYKYDSFGRIHHIVYPDGDVANYHYHQSGQLDSINHTFQGVTMPLIKHYEYDESGRKTQVVYGNDVTTDYRYSRERNWLEYSSTYSKNIGSTLQDLSYKYDAIGNITTISQQAGAIYGFGGQYQNDYSYDDLNRLINSNSHGGKI